MVSMWNIKFVTVILYKQTSPPVHSLLPPGPAFTVIYVVAGLPLARLADTRSRPIVLLLGLLMWSAMILVTGFTVVFWQLLTLRIFLGIGEVCDEEGGSRLMREGVLEMLRIHVFFVLKVHFLCT